MTFLFLLSLIVSAAICGVPSVLFARVLCRIGLRQWPSVVLGSSLLPLIWLGFMTGGRIGEIGRTPFWFPAVAFFAGLAVGATYFRRHA